MIIFRYFHDFCHINNPCFFVSTQIFIPYLHCVCTVSFRLLLSCSVNLIEFVHQLTGMLWKKSRKLLRTCYQNLASLLFPEQAKVLSSVDVIPFCISVQCTRAYFSAQKVFQKEHVVLLFDCSHHNCYIQGLNISYHCYGKQSLGMTGYNEAI